jgi:hypothetical protein
MNQELWTKTGVKLQPLAFAMEGFGAAQAWPPTAMGQSTDKRFCVVRCFDFHQAGGFTQAFLRFPYVFFRPRMLNAGFQKPQPACP